MESPERTGNISAPVDQGSPFFKYLCGLSPIKPARSMHVIQTYAELSLPPPPAVFTSPVNPDRCGGRARRGLLVSKVVSTQVTVVGNNWVGDKENQPNEAGASRSNAAPQADGEQSSSLAISHFSQQQQTCSRLEQGQVLDTGSDNSLRYEYSDVSDYLADPSEGSLYAPASSSQLQTSYLQKSSGPDDYSFQREGHIVVKEINDDSLSSESQDRIHIQDSEANLADRDLSEMHTMSDIRNQQLCLPAERRESLASAASVSNSDHEGSGAEPPMRMDQETAAMAYLLAADVNVGDGARGEWISHQSSLAKLDSRQTPDFVAYEGMSSLAQRSQENFELVESTESEGLRDAPLESKEADMEDKKDVQNGGTVGQRGVRRRCLDFETSVRRKSLGGGSSRRSMTLRSKTAPGSGVTSNIPSSILCERAVATSDATNSAINVVSNSDPQADIPLRSGGTSVGSKVLSAGLSRVSRCSAQRHSESNAGDVCTIDPPKMIRECVGIPSGIGLHLNSLTGGISFSPTNRDFKPVMGMQAASKGAVASLLGMPPLPGVMHGSVPDDFGTNMMDMGNAGTTPKNFTLDSAPGFGPGAMISMMERSRLTLRGTIPGTTPCTGMIDSSTLESLSNGGRHSLDGSSGGAVLERPGSSGNKRLQEQEFPQPPILDFQDEYDSPRSSNKKRRKSPVATGEKSGDGCKRCNCKKSKCLKLYCECFAAGTYCVGSCTCHDCFNKPEHEETVMSTRQLIESRNPLAFAPKIVHSGDTSPKRGEEILETPASARHKRGCNCKKSLCLKKYCECYQAGVGCSDGCRCEGCKNMYGRKEVVDDSDKEIASDVPESASPDAELELPRPGSEAPVGHIYPLRSIAKDLSPTTPSFQYTGQGRSIGRVRSASKKRSISPMCEPQRIAKPSPSPDCLTRSSLSSLQSAKINAQQNPNLQYSRVSPISTPKLSRGNQLSPRWEGLGDICTLTPLPHPPLRPTPASLSTLDRSVSSPSFSCQSIEPMSSYQSDKFDSVSKCSPHRFQQAPNHSPLSSFGSRNIRSLSNHPTPSPSCIPSSFDRQGNPKAQMIARSGTLSTFMSDDDDTPDILKYSTGVTSPMTKRGSPKQKRVSPPHLEGVRSMNRDDRIVFNSPTKSSPGLRRRFVLQALPALPPLLPLSDSSPGQGCNNTQQQV